MLRVPESHAARRWKSPLPETSAFSLAAASLWPQRLESASHRGCPPSAKGCGSFRPVALCPQEPWPLGEDQSRGGLAASPRPCPSHLGVL